MCNKCKIETVDVTMEIYPSYCATSVFRINGVEADRRDFGYPEDRSPDTAPDYGCGDMCFIRIPASQEVLEKYGITEAEYKLIAGHLEVGLSFGYCGWCT